MLGVRRLANLEDEVRECSREFDASWLAPHEAVQSVRHLARVEAMVASMKARAAARVAEANAWTAAGDPSAAVWLAKQSGTTVTDAKAQLETAGKLRELPRLDEAMRRGDLSAAKAATIADAASVNPAAEGELVELAGNESLQGLREASRRAKAAGDPDLDATYRRIHRERRLRAWTDGEGARNLAVRGPADVVAKIEGRLGVKADELFERARAEGRREPREAYVFDAFAAVVVEPHAAPTARAKRPGEPAVVSRPPAGRSRRAGAR